MSSEDNKNTCNFVGDEIAFEAKVDVENAYLFFLFLYI
jgi:hypothetical protein